MTPLRNKLTPTRGFSSYFHNAFVITLPILLFVLVRLEFVSLAFAVVILAKWRMFAVRPRFWPANIRANAVDIIVGISIVIFMQHAPAVGVQFVWAALYLVWLLYVKPRSTAGWVSVQAGLSQFAGLSALYIIEDGGLPLYALSLGSGLICYLAARHFIDSFDEIYARLLSYSWGFTAAAMVWLLGHWLLFYQFVAQPTLLLSAIGYGLAALYYYDHYDRLSALLRRQFIFVMVAVIFVVLVAGVATGAWGNKVV